MASRTSGALSPPLFAGNWGFYFIGIDMKIVDVKIDVPSCLTYTATVESIRHRL